MSMNMVTKQKWLLEESRGSGDKHYFELFADHRFTCITLKYSSNKILAKILWWLGFQIVLWICTRVMAWSAKSRSHENISALNSSWYKPLTNCCVCTCALLSTHSYSIHQYIGFLSKILPKPVMSGQTMNKAKLAIPRRIQDIFIWINYHFPVCCLYWLLQLIHRDSKLKKTTKPWLVFIAFYFHEFNISNSVRET